MSKFVWQNLWNFLNVPERKKHPDGFCLLFLTKFGGSSAGGDDKWRIGPKRQPNNFFKFEFFVESKALTCRCRLWWSIGGAIHGFRSGAIRRHRACGFRYLRPDWGADASPYVPAILKIRPLLRPPNPATKSRGASAAPPPTKSEVHPATKTAAIHDDPFFLRSEYLRQIF